MSVSALSLSSGVYALDARVHTPTAPVRGALVVAHPHPAHGGHMDHPVVVTAAQRAAALGLTAVRFDFRGVRASEGSVTDFLGHLDDWRAAAAWAAIQAAGGPVLGAGFSYGARSVAALLRPDRRERPDLAGLLLLAPATRVPRTKRDFGNLLLGRPISDAARDGEVLQNLRALSVPVEVLVGADDVVAPPDELAAHLPPHAHLPDLNHFFSRDQGAGRTAHDVLDAAIDSSLQALLAG
jgi:alpha/beta superfamily hydrolase